MYAFYEGLWSNAIKLHLLAFTLTFSHLSLKLDLVVRFADLMQFHCVGAVMYNELELCVLRFSVEFRDLRCPS